MVSAHSTLLRYQNVSFLYQGNYVLTLVAQYHYRAQGSLNDIAFIFDTLSVENVFIIDYLSWEYFIEGCLLRYQRKNKYTLNSPARDKFVKILVTIIFSVFLVYDFPYVGNKLTM